MAGGEKIKGKQRGVVDATAGEGRKREEISRKQIGGEKQAGWCGGGGGNR